MENRSAKSRSCLESVAFKITVVFTVFVDQLLMYERHGTFGDPL